MSEVTEKTPRKGIVLQFPSKTQGKAMSFGKLEPWDDDVIGSELAEEIAATIRQYVVLTESATVAITLWVILTYCFEQFTITPILAIVSPEKQCGKTTLLDVLHGLVCKPLLASSITAASVFRVIEKERPTLLIDEADSFIKNDEALRGVLNSGNRASGSVLRTVGENHEVCAFSTYSPKAIALIGSLPDTLQDRSVCAQLRRRSKNERVSRFLSNRVEALNITARKAAYWADSFGHELKSAEPIIPNFLSNRTADNWLPLLAIADLIGDGWGQRARDAAKLITAKTSGDVVSVRTLLLEDIKEIFDKAKVDRLRSDAIANLLINLDERPWAEWKRGQPLSTYQLAYLLRSFSIRSSTIRVNSTAKPAKGYVRSQFEEAWAHYLTDETTASQNNEAAS
jgi:putative DNA primase/helicase